MMENNKARRWLQITFGLMFFRIAYTCFTGITGRGVPMVSTTLFMLALPAVILAGREYARNEYRSRGNYILLSSLALVTLLFRGLMGDALGVILWRECFIFALTLAFLFVGQFDRAWDDLASFLWMFCLGATLLCVISLRYASFTISNDFGLISGEIREPVRWATSTLAYQLNWSLGLWPIIFAIAAQKRKVDLTVLAALVCFGAFLFLQVWFQKRAPSMRGLAYLLSCFIVLRLANRRIPGHLLLFTCLCFVLGVAWVAKTENFGFLIERFRSDDLREGGGRFYELTEMLDSFSVSDWLMGRGLGGFFFIDNWTAGVTEVSESRDVGRATVHIGFFYPLLKGGIVFTLLYFWFAFRSFLPKGRIWKENPYNVAAWIVIPVYVLFLFAEGPPTYTSPLDAVLFGLCCGRFMDCSGRRELIRSEQSGPPVQKARR